MHQYRQSSVATVFLDYSKELHPRFLHQELRSSLKIDKFLEFFHDVLVD
jgi:hypothetical protein